MANDVFFEQQGLLLDKGILTCKGCGKKGEAYLSELRYHADGYCMKGVDVSTRGGTK